MVLVLKHWKSRSPRGIAACGVWYKPIHKVEGLTRKGGPFGVFRDVVPSGAIICDAWHWLRMQPLALGQPHGDAGWSSPVARQAHNLKVVGSNPTPATTEPLKSLTFLASLFPAGLFVLSSVST